MNIIIMNIAVQTTIPMFMSSCPTYQYSQVRARHLHAVVSYMPNILRCAVRRHRSTVNIHYHQTFIPLGVTAVKHDPGNITTMDLLNIYAGF